MFAAFIEMKADLSNVFGKIINFAILFLLSTSSILLFLPGFANAQSQTPGANWNGPWADYQNTNARREGFTKSPAIKARVVRP